MSNIDSVHMFIKRNEQHYCDDCLSEILEIYPRQQINQICRRLSKDDIIVRNKDECFGCKKDKLVNRYKD